MEEKQEAMSRRPREPRAPKEPRRKLPRIPLKVLIILVLIAIALTALITAVTLRTIESKTTRLGFENIGELATQVAYTTNVSKLENTSQIFGINVPGTTASYIFSYDVQIKAGLDFADVRVSADETTHTVTVTLPEIRVLSCELDQDSLKVWNEQKNIFNPLSIDDVNATQASLKEEAERNAVANGLLDNARANAELLLKSFLSRSYPEDQYTYQFIDVNGKDETDEATEETAEETAD